MDLPKSPDAEHGLLSAIIAKYELLPLVIDKVAHEQDLLNLPQNKIIWSVFVDAFNSGYAINYETLRLKLSQSGELKSIGDEYLAELCKPSNHADNWELYVTTLNNYARRRKLITWCANTQDIASKEDISDQKQAELTGEFLSLTATSTTNKTKTQSELAKEGLARAEERKKIRDDDPFVIFGIPTGFTVLDHITEGLQLGDLSIWAGRPASGKSTILANVGENASSWCPSTNTLMRSIEMTEFQTSDRALSSGGQVDIARIRRGELLDNEIQRMKEYTESLLDPAVPFYIDFSREVHIDQLRAQAYIASKFLGVKLFIVDYLQLVHGYDRRNREREIAQVAVGLKSIARDLNIHVAAAAQLNRVSEGKKDMRPTLADIRESDTVAATADLVCLIHRPDYATKPKEEIATQSTEFGVAEIIVAKCRMGVTGKISIGWHGKYSRFVNLTNKANPDSWKDKYKDTEEEVEN
jgi:replicative DNA helicase